MDDHAIFHVASQCLGEACGRCQRVCHLLKHYGLHPKTYFQKALQSHAIDANVPYACNFCGDCKEACPKDLDLGMAFYALRLGLVDANKGRSPLKTHAGVDRHQRLSFSNAFRAKGARPGIKQGVHYAFMPGCSLSAYSPLWVKKLGAHLSDALGPVTRLPMCCGKPTLDLGEVRRFEARYQKLQDEMDRHKVDRVITACQNCLKVVTAHSPQLQTLSLWTLLQEVGLPKDRIGIGTGCELTFEVHDSCPTRENQTIIDAVRWILQTLGYRLVQGTSPISCCGMGGMAAASDFALAKANMTEKANRIQADVAVVYCASCKEALSLGGKPTVHLLDLLFGDVPSLEGLEELTRTTSTLKKWTNRLSHGLIWDKGE